MRSNRQTIQAANEQSAALGRLLVYDSFATALANRYGGDATTEELCRGFAAAAEDAAAAGGDLAELLAVADRLGPPPALPGERCAVSFAAMMHATVDGPSITTAER